MATLNNIVGCVVNYNPASILSSTFIYSASIFFLNVTWEPDLYCSAIEKNNFWFHFLLIYLAKTQETTTRSTRPEVFCKKGVLRNVPKLTEKHMCQRLFLNRDAGMRTATLLKKGLWHRCFPVNFAKFPTISFLQKTSGNCFCTSSKTIKISWQESPHNNILNRSSTLGLAQY